MKTNLKALQLIEKGLSAKTVHKLTESQVNTLHSRLIIAEKKETKEAVTVTKKETTYPATEVDAMKANASGTTRLASFEYCINRPEHKTPMTRSYLDMTGV